MSQLQEALWRGLHKPEGRIVPAEMPRLSLCLSPRSSAATPFTAPTQTKHACSNASLPGSRLNMHTNGPCAFAVFSHGWETSVNLDVCRSLRVTLSRKVGSCSLAVVWMWMLLYTHVHTHNTATQIPLQNSLQTNATACVFIRACTCLSFESMWWHAEDCWVCASISFSTSRP